MIKLLLSFTLTLLCSFSILACGDRKISEFTPLNSTEDSAPGFRSALDALIACKGGTLTIDGPITLRLNVDKNFLNLAQQIIIKGNGSNSQIHLVLGGSTDAFSFHNLTDLYVTGITFIGGGINGLGTADALTVFRLNQTRAICFKNLFVGIGTITLNASVIRVGVGSIVAVDHCNAEVLSTASVVIEDCEFDEGSQWAVVATSSGPELQSLRLARNKINAGIGGGYWLHRIKYLEIDGGLVGLHTGPPQVPAIQLLSVKHATIRNFQTAPTTTANKLVVDGGTIMLKVIDSKFGLITNNAQAWRIEDGSTITSSGVSKVPSSMFSGKAKIQ